MVNFIIKYDSKNCCLKYAKCTDKINCFGNDEKCMLLIKHLCILPRRLQFKDSNNNNKIRAKAMHIHKNDAERFTVFRASPPLQVQLMNALYS